MLRHGVVGQCLPVRAAVDCTRGGRVHTPIPTTSKCAGDTVFRRVSFSSVVLFLHLTLFVGRGAGVHVPRVEVVGSPLPTCQSWGLNSGLQAWQQMFYPLSHLMSLPTLFYFSFLLVYSFILHIWVFACKFLCAWCLRRLKEGSRSPGAEDTK